MYQFTTQDPDGVKIVRYNESLIGTGNSISDANVVHTFTAAEWTAIKALDDSTPGSVVTISETLPPAEGDR